MSEKWQLRLLLNKKEALFMKRKSLIVLVALAMVLAFTMPAMAAQVFVDGQKLDVSTTVESGTTLVPLRAIFQALGATVNWDGSTQTVTANKAQTTVKLQIGSPTAYKNGQPVSLQVPGKIIQGSTMVPLRFVSESLGANVHWDGTTRTITITSSSETIKPEPQPLPQPKPLPTPEPAPVTGKININTASLDELQQIIHIGKDRAEEIIRLRPFSSLDALTRITGIGPARVADIKTEGIAYVD